MYNTREDQIRRDRFSHGKTMAKIVYNTFRRFPRYIDQEEESKGLDIALESAEKMLNTFNTMSEEERAIYLNGEFPLHYLGPDNDLSSDINSPEFPLYLFCDIATMSLDSLFIYEPQVSEKNKTKARDLKNKLEELRSKLTTLEYSDRFDSEKHISTRAWQGMESSRGFFTVKTEEEENYKYYSMGYTITSDDGVWKNGDYYYDNVYRSHHKVVLFAEDEKELSRRRNERYKKESIEFYSHFQKYFKDGIIPSSYQGFEEYLIDPSLDPKIKEELGSFVLMYNEHKNGLKDGDFAHSKHAYIYLEDLQNAERRVAREQAEALRQRQEKDSAIVQARARYKQRNFFWKLLNRKLNPERLDFEAMETPEIQELYTGGKKRK